MANVNLHEFIQDFLADLTARGSSMNTVAAYRNHLNNYAKWCKQTGTDFLTVPPHARQDQQD
ncbi:MAG: site-specific integrase, partial [Desulfitobacteriaceae bacterium]|nr:site-specific integrase [Desulfitobacteriaceae bacterium]